MLQIKDLSFGVADEKGNKEIIKHLDLNEEEGKFVVITGPNGNHIFLPTTGCYNHLGFDMKGVKGYFWTSSIDPENPQNSYYLCFRQGAIANDLAGRMAGRTVRPVCTK